MEGRGRMGEGDRLVGNRLMGDGLVLGLVR